MTLSYLVLFGFAAFLGPHIAGFWRERSYLACFLSLCYTLSAISVAIHLIF